MYIQQPHLKPDTVGLHQISPPSASPSSPSPPSAPPPSSPDGYYVIYVVLVLIVAIVAIYALSQKWKRRLRERRVKLFLSEAGHIYESLGPKHAANFWKRFIDESTGSLFPGEPLTLWSRALGASDEVTDFTLFPARQNPGSDTTNNAVTREQEQVGVKNVATKVKGGLAINNEFGREIRDDTPVRESTEATANWAFPLPQGDSESGSGSGTTQAI